MTILDNLLGNQDSGSQSSSSHAGSLSFSPMLGLETGKILDFSADNVSNGHGTGGEGTSTHLTGVDGLALGVSAPLHLETSDTSSSDYSSAHGGGLLGGLL